MKIKKNRLFRFAVVLLLCSALAASLTACLGGSSPADTASTTTNVEATAPKQDPQYARDIIMTNDFTNEERNRYLREDILFFAEEFPKKHKYPFTYLTKESFQQQTEKLADRVGQLSNHEVFVELNKIIAQVKDAHTSIEYWDGYSYPLRFYLFGDGIYVVNADQGLYDAMYGRVTAINGVPIDEVLKQLTELVSYENESWLKSLLPKYLIKPVHLNGLGLIENEKSTLFTIDKDGQEKEILVPTLSYGEGGSWIHADQKDVFLGNYKQNYEYRYLPEHQTLYFEYNACTEQEGLKFSEFNKQMFEEIEKQSPKRLILDLRSNGGGDSRILNPFTEQLKKYTAKHPDMQVFILIGRNTFSSGMFAIYRTIEAVPNAVTVGEPSGGAIDCYGEVRMFQLPNSLLPIGYSTKYFEFSSDFSYKNSGKGTFVPDVEMTPTFEDYVKGNDVVLNYALSN